MRTIIADGSPGADPRAYRKALGQFATGVTAIATQSKGRPVGVTANSFSSLSLDPPLVLWSISKNSRSHDAFARADHFAVSVLSSEQLHVSRALSGSLEEKFRDIEWRPGHGGAPVIEGALATFECKVEATYPGGDHLLIVGRVLRYGHHSGNVLLYAQGQFCVSDEHPEITAREADDNLLPHSVHPCSSMPISNLVYLAHYLSSAAFGERRRLAGVTLAQSRVLGALSRASSLRIQQVTSGIFLGERVAGDAIRDLLKKGMIESVSDELRLTPAGHELADRILDLVHEFDRELIPDFDTATIQSTKEVLVSFIDRLSARPSPQGLQNSG